MSSHNVKLDRLPDRTPVKLNVTVSPELHRDLQDYADYLNGQHVSSTGIRRKALSSLYLLRLPRHETLPAVSVLRRPVSRAGGGA